MYSDMRMNLKESLFAGSVLVRPVPFDGKIFEREIVDVLSVEKLYRQEI